LSSGALTISSNPLMVVFGVASPATPFFSPAVARAVTVAVEAATVTVAGAGIARRARTCRDFRRRWRSAKNAGGGAARKTPVARPKNHRPPRLETIETSGPAGGDLEQI